jgi:hypothetical protein
MYLAHSDYAFLLQLGEELGANAVSLDPKSPFI